MSEKTGEEKTDKLLNKEKKDPVGLPNSIVMTADGPEGEVPVSDGTEAEPNTESVEKHGNQTKVRKRKKIKRAG